MDCIICSEELKSELFITHCGHHYHNECIKKWLTTKKNCPMCRSKTHYNPYIPEKIRSKCYAHSYRNSIIESYGFEGTYDNINLLSMAINHNMMRIYSGLAGLRYL